MLEGGGGGEDAEMKMIERVVHEDDGPSFFHLYVQISISNSGCGGDVDDDSDGDTCRQTDSPYPLPA
jgi:hypothetical protein